MLALAACGESEPADPLLAKLTPLANPGPPKGDKSNKYVGNPDAIALGKKLYFDPDFSGKSTEEDMLRRPMTTAPRAPKGQPTGVACNTCHDVSRGGSDHSTDPPGNRVSFGAGAYDVNGQQTINSAYLDLVYWNGRNDSLWSQIVAVTESHVSVGGSRARTAWRLADAYRAEYNAVFTANPIPPELDSVAQQKARLESDGTCKLDGGSCPPACWMATSKLGQQYCLPRFPLEGRPGFEFVGQMPECEYPIAENTLQPNNDAYDCMQLADQLIVTRMHVNYAKAIAAYEYTLLSANSPFDRWVTSGFTSTDLSAAAVRGARLFVGKAVCSECHSGPMLSDNLFHNIGVPQSGAYIPTVADCPKDGWCDCVSEDRFLPRNCLPFGQRDGLRKLQSNSFRRDSKWSDDSECQSPFSLHSDPNYAAEHPDECDGRVKHYSAPLTAAMEGAWKTPPLRDVALTAPYMHNGMYQTLREVVVHYNNGGEIPGQTALGSKDSRIRKLNLTEREIDDLVAFMESLTGTIDAGVIAPPQVPAPSGF